MRAFHVPDACKYQVVIHGAVIPDVGAPHKMECYSRPYLSAKNNALYCQPPSIIFISVWNEPTQMLRMEVVKQA